MAIDRSSQNWPDTVEVSDETNQPLIFTDQTQRELLRFKPCSYTTHGNGCYSVLNGPYYWLARCVRVAIVFDPFTNAVPCWRVQ